MHSQFRNHFSIEDDSSARRDGRVVDYSGLENRRAERHRGFESLSLRYQKELSKSLSSFFAFRRGVSPTGRGFLLRFSTQASPYVAERESLSLRYQKELSKSLSSFFVYSIVVSSEFLILSVTL